MGTRLLWVVLALFNLGLIGCGNDNSNTNNTKRVIVDEEALDPFCSNFEESNQCDSFREEGFKFGWEDYFGDDEGFSDSAFDGGGGFCGCRRGFQPVIYRGLRMCEPRFPTDLLYSRVYIQYRRSGENESLRISFRYRENLTSERIVEPLQGLCFRSASLRCKRDKDCQLRDRRGFLVDTRCEPIQGRNYGYCRRTDAERL